MSGVSIEQAHKLLALRPATQRADGIPSKNDIHQAYRLAAKRFHPDARYPQSTPCALQFRKCHEARDTLIKYYYHNPGIQMRRHRRSQSWHPTPDYSNHMMQSSARQHWKYKKYTMSFKAIILCMVACEGMVKHFSTKETEKRNDSLG